MMIVVTIPQSSYIKAAHGAVLPWRSIDAIAKVSVRSTEPQAVIDRCLSCISPECWNCVASRSKKALTRKETH